mmetsp:Transcript_1913/g.3516  ORF Transcript_1913/g.3516 Transcript_1913/m.3516 type:complete len:91 (+) Transcript_1913:11-283(+)
MGIIAPALSIQGQPSAMPTCWMVRLQQGHWQGLISGIGKDAYSTASAIEAELQSASLIASSSLDPLRYEHFQDDGCKLSSAAACSRVSFG